MEAFKDTDYNGESSFEALKALAMLRGVYTELKWKFTPWLDEVLERMWREIHSEHEDVSTVSTFAVNPSQLSSIGSRVRW